MQVFVPLDTFLKWALADSAIWLFPMVLCKSILRTIRGK